MMRRAGTPIAIICILLACVAVSQGARQVLQVTSAPISSGVQTGAGTAFNNFAPVGGSGSSGGAGVNSGNATRTTTPASSSAAPTDAPAAEAPPARSQGLITAGDLGASNIYFTPGGANNCVGRACGRRLD